MTIDSGHIRESANAKNEWRPLILIVEDDLETARLNARILKRQGYDVLITGTVAEARIAARENSPDLFVLDIILPDGDGLALCKEFRKVYDAPVIFLTGQRRTSDKIAGLSEGGDYYLTKPYSIDELLAVVTRLYQRTVLEKKKVAEAVMITRGPLTLRIPRMMALVNGRDVGLTQKEFALLLMLVQNEDVEISSEKIFEHVWNTSMNNDSGALRAQMTRLKKKLDEGNTDDFSIVYKQGRGYTFTTK